MMELTKEQQHAIYNKGNNILVSASAGSGKTFVLSKRIINRIINDRDNIEDFLLLTFTENAAMEMKNRVRQGLEEELNSLSKETDSDLYIHIKEQLSNIIIADISTIHSFCQKIIRDNIEVVGLSAGFDMIEKSANSKLRSEILDEILNDELKNADENFHKLFYIFGKRKDIEKLKQNIFSIYNKIISLSNSSDLINKYKSITENDFKNTFSENEIEEILKTTTTSDLQADFSYQVNILNKLFDIIEKFDELYHKSKIEQNKIDFNDMERYCLEILQNEEIRCKVSENYKEVLVDECQDLSGIQYDILNYVSNGNNMFMVGDIKQSIYKFRNAMPELFYNKISEYHKSSKDEVIYLNRNFRSREEILKGCNIVFKDLMNSDDSDIKFNKGDEFYISPDFKPDSEYKINYLYIQSEKKDAQKSTPEVQEVRDELEARKIADIIKELISKRKDINYKDIAILCSKNKQCKYIKKILEKYNISCSLNSNDNYLQEPETRTIINLLSVIDNPHQDIPLCDVLTSVIAGLNMSEIGSIKAFCKDKDLYECCLMYINQNKDNLSIKLTFFIDMIKRYRFKSFSEPTYKIIMEILDETGYIYYLKGRENSENHLTNINMLIEKASSYEETTYKGIYNFLRYIEYVNKYEIKEDLNQGTSSDLNKVIITTIHKSKGMEYPVVILPFMSRELNKGEQGNSDTFDNVYGFAFKNEDYINRVERDAPILNFINERVKKLELSERLRTLYVAMTRPKKLLYIISSGARIETREFDKRKSFDDFLIPIVRNDTNKDIFNFEEINSEDIYKKDVKKKIEYKDKKLDITELANKLSKLNLDKEIIKNISNLEGSEYKYKSIENIKQKISVSDLKEKNAVVEKTYDVKIFNKISDNKASSGINTGNIYHKILEKIDYKKINLNPDYSNIEKCVDYLVDSKVISSSDKEIIDINNIVKMFNSSIGEILLEHGKNDKIKREEKFMMMIPAKDYYDIDTDEDILLQGIIDLYVETDNGVILIDYKSDKAVEKNYYISNYKTQLDYYAKAIEQIKNEKVYKKYIYSINMNEFIEV